MGVSTDGILAYGILLDSGAYPWAELVGGDADLDFYEARDAWLARQDSLAPPPARWPLAIENFCSDSCPEYALVVQRSWFTANRGYPRVVDPQAMVALTEVYHAEFLKGAEVLGLDLDALGQQPRWLLMSYWG